ANAGATIKINSAFNGKGDTKMLTGDSTSTLAIAQVDTVYFTVRVFHQNNSGPYFSSIIASGTFGTAVAVDTSNNGLEIIPTDNSPTVVRIPVPLNTEVKIPAGFSPNGDGKNDTFIIEIPLGVELEEFYIYNRWGQLVYTDENLNVALTSGWNGEANTGILATSAGVPDGTYYYSIKLSNEEKRRVDFITV
ncbi:MAG: gliding motility-associated C-terminal domain-containing protein, partial [Spirosomaceae bacterium]|nr:gliding motility-associated C-terminal domain-containing protein [Spirosomataceae bacterium]